jgi:serine protease Do
MENFTKAVSKHFSLILICLLSIALGVALVGSRPVQTAYAVDQATVNKSQRGALQSLENAFVSIANELEPTVVNITSEKYVEDSRRGMGDFFQGFPFLFPMPEPRGNDEGDGSGKRTIKSNGSGVIVRSDATNAYILTNDHVVDGADRVEVTLNDGRKFKGTVLRDPKTDLAVVKIEAKNLPAAKLGNSDNVRVGQWAIAIGNPFELNNTLTVGVVSAVTREFAVPDRSNPEGVKYYPDAIQTDASINPGNSGGPLVNINGEVIGINSAIYSPSGGNVGVGFAVPSNTAKFVLEQLITKGKVVRGYLGINPENLGPVLQEKWGIKEGSVVTDVGEGTPASKAGIKEKDVITSVDGKRVKDALDLRRIVAAIAPGTKVKVGIVRRENGKNLPMNLEVTVGEAPDGSSPKSEATKSKVGLSVETLTPEIAEDLNIKRDIKGVVVRSVAPGSAAQRAGIRRGDVILEVEDSQVKTVAQFDAAVSKLKAGSTAVLLVVRGNRTQIVEMTID